MNSYNGYKWIRNNPYSWWISLKIIIKLIILIKNKLKSNEALGTTQIGVALGLIFGTKGCPIGL